MYSMNLPEISFTTQAPEKAVTVYPYFKKKGEPALSVASIPAHLDEFLPVEAGGTFLITHEKGVYLMVCMGESEKQMEQKIVNAIKGLSSSVSEISVDLTLPKLWDISMNYNLLVSKTITGLRNPWSVRKEQKPLVKRNVTFVTSEKVPQKQQQKAIALGKTQAWVQKLVAMPANYLTPQQFVVEVQEFIDALSDDVKGKLKFTPRNKAWVVEQGMGSFYAVAQGSVNPLTFLEITYAGKSDDLAEPLVLVGKGVTFDTGGISLKPSKGMGDMKGDMAGAATACAGIFYAAMTGLKDNVVTLAPCCENMPDGNAIKPGDVVTAMNGKTIEITNTDAEGRLILADALVYAQKFNGRYTVDMATLTGACITAIGYEYTGLFTDCQEVSDMMVSAGKEAKDWVWPLPMDSELHQSMLKSAVADMSNSSEGAGGAGATNGAIFLKEFAPEKGWVHLDIAGVSEVRGSAAPTGRPLPMLTVFMENAAKAK